MGNSNSYWSTGVSFPSIVYGCLPFDRTWPDSPWYEPNPFSPDPFNPNPYEPNPYIPQPVNPPYILPQTVYIGLPYPPKTPEQRISELEWRCTELELRLANLDAMRKELQDSKELRLAPSPIPEKWRKAIDTVLDGIDNMELGVSSISNSMGPIFDTWQELAARDIVRASRTKDVRDIDSAASALICWLAEELEKDRT